MKKIHKKVIRVQASALAKHAKAYVHSTPGSVEDFENIDDYRRTKGFMINRTMVMGMVPSWSDHKKARMIRLAVRHEKTFLQDTGRGLPTALFFYEPNKAIVDEELKRLTPKRKQRLLVRPKRYEHVIDLDSATISQEQRDATRRAINKAVCLYIPPDHERGLSRLYWENYIPRPATDENDEGSSDE